MNEWQEDQEDEKDPEDPGGHQAERSTSEATGWFDFQLKGLRILVSLRAALVAIGIGSVMVLYWLLQAIRDILIVLMENRK